MMEISQQVFVKRWKPILEEYEKIQNKVLPRSFRLVKDLCLAHHISNKELRHYYRKWQEGKKQNDSLLPAQRGARPGSRRTPKAIERNILKAYRRFGSNRYELVLLFKPYYLDKTPSPATMDRIKRRYPLNPVQKEIIKKVNIPIIGLGTWRLTGEKATETVKKAIQMGYNHIDTAEMYDNEKQIGEAIKGFDREKLFLTSKVWYDNLKYQSVIHACNESLKRLGIDYLNLYLIHWSNPSIDMRETFQALKNLRSEGLIKAVGVSNFTVKHLEQALPICQSLSLPIVISQVEFHPFLYQESLLNFCRKNNIYLTAYRPIAKGLVNEDEIIVQLAENTKKRLFRLPCDGLSNRILL